MNKQLNFVIVKGRRPASLGHLLPVELNEMMEDSRADNPIKRPTFESICEILAQGIKKYNNSTNFFHAFSFRRTPSSGRSQPRNAGGNDRYMSAEKRDGYGDYDDYLKDDNENSTDEDSKMSLKFMRHHNFHSPKIKSAQEKVKETWDGKILTNLTSPPLT